MEMEVSDKLKKRLAGKLFQARSGKRYVCVRDWCIRIFFVRSKATLVGISKTHDMPLRRKPDSLKLRRNSVMLNVLPIAKPQSHKFRKRQANFLLDILQSLNHLLILIPPSHKLQRNRSTRVLFRARLP